jgi:hypothetical protein|tara:strand:+ start:6999 stop:8255 length:1257 start_codon:yes stop_codon:yes gene_type:complete
MHKFAIGIGILIIIAVIGLFSFDSEKITTSIDDEEVSEEITDDTQEVLDEKDGIVIDKPETPKPQAPAPTPTPSVPEEPEETDPADTRAPSISNVTTSNVSETEATVSWETDEISNSKIVYNNTSPATGGTSQIDTSFTTTHSIALSGLNTGTTYYYVVSSADTAGNTGVSAEQSFTTVAEVVLEPEPTPEEPAAVTNLIGHWTFNDGAGTTAVDSSGNSNDISFVNIDSSIAWVVGQVDGAVKFDGVDDYATIPHSESLNLGRDGESYSISFWFKRDGRPQGERRIIGKGGTSGASPFMIRFNQNGYPSFRVSDGISATTITPKQGMGNNLWHHVAAVRDGSAKTIRLVVDNEEPILPIEDETTGSIANSSDIVINRYHVGGTAFFFDPFNLDDLRIYDRAISTEEITELFNSGRGL